MMFSMMPSELTIYGPDADHELVIESICAGEWHVHRQVIWWRDVAWESDMHYGVSHRSGMAVLGIDSEDAACALAMRLAELPPCPVDNDTALAMSHGIRRRTRVYKDWLERVRAVRRAFTEEYYGDAVGRRGPGAAATTLDDTTAPFPHFGGKQPADPSVWEALGAVDRYPEAPRRQSE